MLLGPLTHPGLAGTLAAAGHGSQVLLADGNYPHSTGARESVPRVHLNLRPGLLDVDQVLEVLLAAVPVEAAAVMTPGDGQEVPAHTGYRAVLGEVGWRELGRREFYDACRGPDLALVVATGDQRLYANLLLTLGVRGPGS
ncbi:RbsD/FucU domain-containing protein [Georgenia sp. SUBG003]|uniref:RbsD/FucU domain-containing protein n=1 Tax=Georgenia sp. SUBG003 TaxID=1497974 RepID=UPI0004DA9A86|nr:RbsD or FucU transport [Georgenia sp. SUBG003]